MVIRSTRQEIPGHLWDERPIHHGPEREASIRRSGNEVCVRFGQSARTQLPSLINATDIQRRQELSRDDFLLIGARQRLYCRGLRDRLVEWCRTSQTPVGSNLEQNAASTG